MASELLLVNPRKRKSTTKRVAKRKTRRPAKRAASSARRAPVRRRRASPVRRRRTYRRNPAPRGLRGIQQMAMPAFQGALGSTVLNVAFGYLPLPPMLRTGMMKHVTKAAGAVALGMVVDTFAKGSTAKAMAQGAMTVAFADWMKELATNVPGIKLGEYDYDAMGFYSPAQIVGTETVGEYVNGVGGYNAQPEMMGEYVEGGYSDEF